MWLIFDKSKARKNKLTSIGFYLLSNSFFPSTTKKIKTIHTNQPHNYPTILSFRRNLISYNLPTSNIHLPNQFPKVLDTILYFKNQRFQNTKSLEVTIEQSTSIEFIGLINLYILKNEITNPPQPSLRVFYKMRQLFIKCIENIEAINQFFSSSRYYFAPLRSTKSLEMTIV